MPQRNQLGHMLQLIVVRKSCMENPTAMSQLNLSDLEKSKCSRVSRKATDKLHFWFKQFFEMLPSMSPKK